MATVSTTYHMEKGALANLSREGAKRYSFEVALSNKNLNCDSWEY